MATAHFLNVGPGDCTIIQHTSDRVTMLDICCGNSTRIANKNLSQMLASITAMTQRRMCDDKAQPLDYLDKLGITEIHRLILSHPDMDHMDGLSALLKEKTVTNFWDSGVRRTAPDFSDDFTRFKEADWKAYEALINGTATSKGGSLVPTVERLAGKVFPYANRPTGEHDGLYILAPDKALRDEASASPDTNDGSYALLYRSAGGKIILPGDSYDETWDHVIAQYSEDVSDCAFLLAPHHGRDSNRSYEYLDLLKPKLTLMGCAPAKHVNFSEWDRRGLAYITSNDAGNVVLKVSDAGLAVYVQNKTFAQMQPYYVATADEQDNYHIGTIFLN